MGVIPKVAVASPAFIHVDVDDLWAIGRCYGYEVSRDWAHRISEDALPRFRSLFSEMGIQGTFFLVGRDLEHEAYADEIRGLMGAGHQVANHSYSHHLGFRGLSRDDLAREIDGCHELMVDKLNVAPVGFRAPGYGWTTELTGLLDERGYRYDGSLMPSPFGGVFRWMDRRLQVSDGTQDIEPKTQYPLFSDTLHPLYPQQIRHGRMIQLPTAASPLVRLPFQAGVCMRLGYGYFRTCFQPYIWNRALPVVFLFHGADLADFSGVPGKLFEKSRFFNRPVDERVALARRFLETIGRFRPFMTTEDWLA